VGRVIGIHEQEKIAVIVQEVANHLVAVVVDRLFASEVSSEIPRRFVVERRIESVENVDILLVDALFHRRPQHVYLGLEVVVDHLPDVLRVMLQ